MIRTPTQTTQPRTDIWIWLHEEKERMDSFKDWRLSQGEEMKYFTADEWNAHYQQFRVAIAKAEG